MQLPVSPALPTVFVHGPIEFIFAVVTWHRRVDPLFLRALMSYVPAVDNAADGSFTMDL